MAPGLADLLALPARDLFPDRLDHLVTGGHAFRRFGDVVRQMTQIFGAAARARLRRWDHDLVAGQVRREVAARGPGEESL